MIKMQLPAFIRNMPRWLVAALSAIAGVVPGVWLNCSDFRTKRIEANSPIIETSIKSTDDLRPLLDKFILMMNDKTAVTVDERERLTTTIRQIYSKAEDVKNRLGGVDNEFKALADALVNLKDGAERMTGSLNGKQFFKSYADWIVADQNWREKVQTRQNSYLSSFRF